ncbi:MAG TPA: substrate-binding domain-containing protein [Acidobacteriota bacterium]|nr:substrate-binding domain-containing protein [Acidobacteriota bacterium]
MKIVKPSNVLPALLVCFIGLSVLSCNKEEQRETPTQGSLTMISSEDVYPIIDLQVKDFIRIYEQTKIIHLSSSTRDAIVQLLNDSVKLIVSPRDFNEEEKRVITQNELDVTTTKLAYDGVAVIVNSQNSVRRITVEDLKNILTGKIERWPQVEGSTLMSAIIVAMGEPNSGVYEYVKTRIAGGEQFAPIVLPCKTTTEVFSAVKERPNTIGFAAVAWLSKAPPDATVLEIGDPNFKQDTTSAVMEYFGPHQAHIYRNYYPLSRTIYIFTHKTGRGVALGFSSFAAGVDGQKIIVKNGLVPATMPVRLVQLNSQ